MKQFVLILITTIALSGCSSLKLVKLLKQGEVEQPSFTAEFPFEMRMGLVIIKVNINGKDHDFMLDTGAPNVVTQELAKELQLIPRVTKKTGDSQGKKEPLEFAEMPEMLIGGVHFIETGTAIADLKRSNEIACLQIDGLVGANLMKEAIWQIDYERKVITISNDSAAFSIPENAYRIPFTPANSATPLITITYDGVEDKFVTFDTGSNGYFNSSPTIRKELQKEGKADKYSIGVGASTSGLYGVGDTDSTYTAFVAKTILEDLVIDHQLVAFGKGARTLGTEFLIHYRVILNWSTEEIILIPVDDFVNNTLENFGITPFYVNEKLEVKSVLIGCDAAKLGIQLGDQILAINGRDTRLFTKEMWCEFLYDGFIPKGQTTLELVILHNGQEQKLVLEKKDWMKNH